jgi:nitroimidazol reductase NimA-like FMN-containing flavoprotein (pyridoxamine 5'-phosphate oxidase superfamily)
MRNDTKRDQFQNKEYIRLETFKKNGQVVSTPVWFVVNEDVLYIRSYANSGKVKRMRNKPYVRVTLEIKISQHLYRKYGLMKMSFDFWGAIKQLDWAVFAIEV